MTTPPSIIAAFIAVILFAAIPHMLAKAQIGADIAAQDARGKW